MDPICPSEPFSATKRRKVLIVDDSRDNADMLAIMCDFRGFDPMAVYAGADALLAARTFEPDAILLDIGLPDLNGYDVARALRFDGFSSNSILIAVSGFGRGQDKSMALDAGCDAHFTKPVEIDELIGCIDRLLQQRSLEPGSGSRQKPSPFTF